MSNTTAVGLIGCVVIIEVGFYRRKIILIQAIRRVASIKAYA